MSLSYHTHTHTVRFLHSICLSRWNRKKCLPLLFAQYGSRLLRFGIIGDTEAIHPFLLSNRMMG